MTGANAIGGATKAVWAVTTPGTATS